MSSSGTSLAAMGCVGHQRFKFPVCTWTTVGLAALLYGVEVRWPNGHGCPRWGG